MHAHWELHKDETVAAAPLVVPQIGISEPRLRQQVELILYNYDFRLGVARVRQEYGLPAAGDTSADLERWNANTNFMRSCEELRYVQFDAPLSPAWNDFIFMLVLRNALSRPPAGEKNSFRHPWSRHFLQCEIYGDTEAAKGTYLGIRIYGEMSRSELISIIDSDVMPRLRKLGSPFQWAGQRIELCSQVADMCRLKKAAGHRYSVRQQAIDLEKLGIDLDEMQVIDYRRLAKKHNL